MQTNNPNARFSRIEIDTLRGLALVAVVWHHAVIWLGDAIVLMGQSQTVFHVIVESIATTLEPLRMPLFTILSGWVYALKPASLDVARPFVTGKVRRILIPLFFLSTVQYFQAYWLRDEIPVLRYQGGIPIEPEGFWMFWFFHFGHLWFLQALFSLFMVMLIIDGLGWMRSIRSWLFWLALMVLLPYLWSGRTFWSLNKMIPLAVFFFFGVGLYRFRDYLFRPEWRPWAWLIFLLAMMVHALRESGWVDLNHREVRPFLVLAGTVGAYCLLNLRLKASWLARLGVYSYAVYLYHGLAFETHQWFDDLVLGGIPGRVVWFALLLVAGLGIPILIDRIFAQVRWVRTPVLGRSP